MRSQTRRLRGRRPPRPGRRGCAACRPAWPGGRQSLGGGAVVGLGLGRRPVRARPARRGPGPAGGRARRGRAARAGTPRAALVEHGRGARLRGGGGGELALRVAGGRRGRVARPVAGRARSSGDLGARWSRTSASPGSSTSGRGRGGVLGRAADRAGRRRARSEAASTAAWPVDQAASRSASSAARGRRPPAAGRERSAVGRAGLASSVGGPCSGRSRRRCQGGLRLRPGRPALSAMAASSRTWSASVAPPRGARAVSAASAACGGAAGGGGRVERHLGHLELEHRDVRSLRRSWTRRSSSASGSAVRASVELGPQPLHVGGAAPRARRRRPGPRRARRVGRRRPGRR